MTRKHLFFVSLLLMIGNLVLGQEKKIVRDIGLWTEIKIEKKIIKKLRISTSQHLRYNNNFTAFDDYISEFGLAYSINKHFSIGTNGRYTRNKKYDETSQNDYRYDFDFKYESKISESLKIYYRLRYQKEFYGSGVFYKAVNYYESAVRNRIKIGWKKLDDHRIYTSVEIYRLTKKSREPIFDKYRIFIGNDYSSPIGGIGLALGFEHQLNSHNPYNYFILKLKYELQL